MREAEREGEEEEEKGAAAVAEISVDKLTSNRILLREREGGGVGTRRKVIENRSGLASSEPQLFRVFLRGSDAPLSLRHLLDKPAPSS